MDPQLQMRDEKRRFKQRMKSDKKLFEDIEIIEKHKRLIKEYKNNYNG